MNDGDDNPQVLFPLEPSLLSLIIESYTGETTVKDGLTLYHGHGTAVFKDGHTYTGKFSQGRMHGEGTYKWKADDGTTTYVGNFVHNSMTGSKCKYTWKNHTDSTSTYIGDVVNGLRHGIGKFTKDQICYNGHWKDGKRHGPSGHMIYDPEVYYDGPWKDGKRHGPSGGGVMHYKGGNTYDGGWEDDRKCGYGVMTWKNETYSGMWKDDLQNGVGTHVWNTSNNRYDGMFKNGAREGIGKFSYASGATYEGEWVQNLKEGDGVFTYEDGRIFAGRFIRDRKEESDSTIPNTSLVLFIKDIISKDDTTKDVDNAVLRINTELKNIYKFYSVRDVMTVGDLWVFLRDCQVITSSDDDDDDNVLSIAAVDRMIASMRLQIELEKDRVIRAASIDPQKIIVLLENSKNNIHDPSQEILFRDFVEILVRIANVANSGSLPEKLINLYLSKIRNNFESVVKHSKESEDSEEGDVVPIYKKVRYDVALRAVLKKYEEVLHSVFSANTTTRTCSNDDDITMTVRQFISLLKSSGVITKFKGGDDDAAVFTMSSVLKMLQNREDSVAGDVDLFELDLELVFSEYEEMIVRVADAQMPQMIPVQIKLDKFIQSTFVPTKSSNNPEETS